MMCKVLTILLLCVVYNENGYTSAKPCLDDLLDLFDYGDSEEEMDKNKTTPKPDPPKVNVIFSTAGNLSELTDLVNKSQHGTFIIVPGPMAQNDNDEKKPSSITTTTEKPAAAAAAPAAAGNGTAPTAAGAAAAPAAGAAAAPAAAAPAAG